MRQDSLTRGVKLLAFVVLAGFFLSKAKPFLVPIVFAGLLSMLLTPLCMKLEGWRTGRALAVILSVLVLMAVAALIISVLAWQVSDLSKNAGDIEKNVTEKVNQIREYITGKLGISPQKQSEIIQKQQQASDSRITGLMTGALASAGAALTNIVLVLVYIFLFMYFRDHLKGFVLKLIAKTDQAEAKRVISDGRKVAQKYLTGLAMMIVSLWIMYSIGFSIVGVKNAVFFAILCGLLEIVPFVGNLAGNLITIFMALAQGGDMNLVIGILIVYAIVQFFQSYILEPLVVGKEVNIHPMFTIIGIVAGEFIWGIPGMILAIPVMGIVKIICDHVEVLKPYGYLLGEVRSGKQEGLVSKIKQLFQRK